MVREYSLSLSAPDTLALPVPPRIEAPQMAIPDTIERAQEPVAIPLAANALAAGVTAADAVDAPASPIPLAASVSVPAPAADPRPEAKREQTPQPAPPSPSTHPRPPGPTRAPARHPRAR